jgi:hypothetical protein
MIYRMAPHFELNMRVPLIILPLGIMNQGPPSQGLEVAKNALLSFLKQCGYCCREVGSNQVIKTMTKN